MVVFLPKNVGTATKHNGQSNCRLVHSTKQWVEGCEIIVVSASARLWNLFTAIPFPHYECLYNKQNCPQEPFPLAILPLKPNKFPLLSLTSGLDRCNILPFHVFYLSITHFISFELYSWLEKSRYLNPIRGFLSPRYGASPGLRVEE